MASDGIRDRVSFLRRCFGSAEIARDGINVAVKCPRCDKNNLSQKKKLSINIETWQFHCWVCEFKGKSLFPLIKGISSSELLEEYNLKYSQTKYLKKIDDEISAVFLPKDYCFLGDLLGSKDPDIKASLKYLKNREISERDVWHFKLGTAREGKFRRRIIIPSFDREGDLNYYVSRSIDKGASLKYVNSKVDKKRIIFNEINVDWKKELTIVEGPFDLMKCDSNATCLLGSNLSEDSLLFSKITYNKTPILIGLDSDMIKKKMKIAQQLSLFDCNVRMLDLKRFLDVGEMTKAEFIKLKSQSIPWSRDNSLFEKIRSIDTDQLI